MSDTVKEMVEGINTPVKVEENHRPIMKMPVIIDKVDLTGRYKGWWFTARINPKMEMFSQLISGAYYGMVTALSELCVKDWNFVDEEGDPLPQPHTTRQKYEKWEAVDAGQLNEEQFEQWRDNKPMSPQELIGKLNIDLVFAMSKAIGKRVQDIDPN